jgi:hypothetical protein
MIYFKHKVSWKLLLGAAKNVCVQCAAVLKISKTNETLFALSVSTFFLRAVIKACAQQYSYFCITIVLLALQVYS